MAVSLTAVVAAQPSTNMHAAETVTRRFRTRPHVSFQMCFTINLSAVVSSMGHQATRGATQPTNPTAATKASRIFPTNYVRNSLTGVLLGNEKARGRFQPTGFSWKLDVFSPAPVAIRFP